jgi:endonuclease YncB( thermonuclease family)
MATLMIDGTLDLSQFWPQGESDADTTKIVIDVTGIASPIHYQQFPNGPIVATRVYDKALVRPFGVSKPVINQGKLTVRLQGLDAPELHVQPGSLAKVKWKGNALGSLAGTGQIKKYRQAQAETAVVRLAAFLASIGRSPLPCRFISNVDHEQGPADAIDKYGRFVGNIFMRPGSTRPIDVNLWILAEGLALVALYNSMTRDEIDACIQAWSIGGNAAGGVCRFVTKTVGRFDVKRLYRKKGSDLQDERSERFIHPKLYRRQCTWSAYKNAKRFTSGFDTFLGLSKDDVFFETADFLNSGPLSAVQIPLDEMVAGGRVVYSADEIVFKEGASTLFDRRGRRIQTW